MLVILSGATCSGKTTIAGLLEHQGFNRVVTCTTRPRRPEEIDGISYHFLSEVDFAKTHLLERNQHGEHQYGLGMDEIKKHAFSNEHAVLIIEPNGFAKVRRYLEANNAPFVSIFLSVETWTAILRLFDRAQTKEEMAERLAVMFDVESKWADEVVRQYDMMLETDEMDNESILDIINYHVNAKVNSLSKKAV